MTRCGTASGYKNGCRCGSCRSAVAADQRKYRGRHRPSTENRGGTFVVDAPTPCFHDPDFWYSKEEEVIAEAKRICLSECPMLDACRAECDRYEPNKGVGDWAGVWAGEDPRDRRARRRGEARRRTMMRTSERIRAMSLMEAVRS